MKRVARAYESVEYFVHSFEKIGVVLVLVNGVIVLGIVGAMLCLSWVVENYILGLLL